jgi:hypothetical protein
MPLPFIFIARDRSPEGPTLRSREILCSRRKDRALAQRLNPDRHQVNTDHCARRTPAYFARKSSMLRPPARFGRCHLPPITAYPWISILASGTASAVMVIRALPGKLSPNTSRRIWVRRSP